MSFPIDIMGKLVVDFRAREWCRLPYPDHSAGCPNYDHKSTCPPQVCLISDFVDVSGPLWLLVEPFNLAAHAAKLGAKHSGWSERQRRCVLYWQGSVNKKLKAGCRAFAEKIGGVYTLCPEAMGVQVIRTAAGVGLPIKPRPTDWVFKIGLVGMEASNV